MTRRVSAEQAGACLKALPADAGRGDQIVIEQDGRDIGVLLSAVQYHRLASTRERFWKLADLVHDQNPELSEEVAELIAVQAVKEVREETWLREQRTGTRDARRVAGHCERRRDRSVAVLRDVG